MSLLESITKGKENKPPRLLIYGTEGVGKSTYAASAPNPIFIQTEDGLDEISTAKFPLAHSLNDVLNALAALRDEQHDFRTVVLDSADWLERLIWDKVCQDFGVRSIEKADGGYGKGYVHALTYWRQIVSLLNDLRNVRGMIVIVDIEEHQAVPSSFCYAVTSRQRCRARLFAQRPPKPWRRRIVEIFSNVGRWLPSKKWQDSDFRAFLPFCSSYPC